MYVCVLVAFLRDVIVIFFVMRCYSLLLLDMFRFREAKGMGSA